MDIRREDGIAMVIAMMAMLLMTALGVALILTTSSETMIAGNFRNSQEGLYAADAAIERAMDDILTVPDWNKLLDGSTQSAFVDGAPTGQRTLLDGSTIDLTQALNMANCQKVTTCSAGDLTAITSERPWGVNNPVWRLYGYGNLRDMLPATDTINSPDHLVREGGGATRAHPATTRPPTRPPHPPPTPRPTTLRQWRARSPRNTAATRPPGGPAPPSPIT